MGVRGKILNIIQSMYSNIKSRVIYDKINSHEFLVFLELDRDNVYLHFFAVCT